MDDYDDFDLAAEYRRVGFTSATDEEITPEQLEEYWSMNNAEAPEEPDSGFYAPGDADDDEQPSPGLQYAFGKEEPAGSDEPSMADLAELLGTSPEDYERRRAEYFDKLKPQLKASADYQLIHKLFPEEYGRLKARDLARREYERDLFRDMPTTTAGQMLPGGDAVFSKDNEIKALWGWGEEVLLADGEALMITGGQGSGKTTLGQQLTLGMCGVPGFETLLSYPVTPASGKVLYLAMDRPKQALRSLRRMVSEEHREVLNAKLVFRAGPPPEDFAQDPMVLLSMCKEVGATAVFVDSIKDAAVGISKDEVGSAYNRARQMAISAGVQVIELHHQKKSQSSAGGKAEITIDTIYGSTWLTSGAGSVIFLEGQPGDPVVKLRHLKQPAMEVGPFDVVHDHATGRSTREDPVDLLSLAADHPITVAEAACAMYSTKEPTRAVKEKARRKIAGLVKDGALTAHNTTPVTTWTAAL